ncbi:MAG: RDD family protein [Caulobacteraceae bacterium]
MSAAARGLDAREGERVRRLVTPEGTELHLVLGSAGERASALIIDLVIIVVALIVLTVAALSTAAALGFKGAEGVLMIWLLGAFILRSGYFIILELGGSAATIGKRILGLRVASRDGGRLTAEAIFVRNALREIEVFLPITFLLASRAAGDPVSAWLVLLGLTWTAVFAFFPLFNRDRLRAGDLVAGTFVIRAPKLPLLADLAEPMERGAFAFTPAQAAAYGVKELHVLETVLRRADPVTVKAVAERIRGKIGWPRAESESAADFLAAYYAALRARLERRLLFGHRRRDKFDKA